MACVAVCETPDGKVGELGSCISSTSSSSIGKNSDLSRSYEDDDYGESEIQSSYRGPLDALGALEEVLPVRRGISKFYSGKSISFSCLSDASSSSSSMKDVTKPENAYSRKRRNLLACSEVLLNRNHSFSLRSNGGRISKRPLHPVRSTLAFAVAGIQKLERQMI